MAKLKVDFTGVESFVRAEEGRHTAKIIKAEVRKTSAGDDMISATLEIMGGVSKGARVFDNYPITPKALWKLKQVLGAIGLKADGRIMIDTDNLLNKVVTIEVEHEEYGGQLRARVRGYYSAATTHTEAEEEGGIVSPEDLFDAWDQV